VERFFEAIQEDYPGRKWQTLFHRHWQAYRRWFLSEGHKARPRYLTSIRMLKRYMPEILPTYERLVELAGGGDLAARFLAMYCPPPYLNGCSQAVWPGPDPLLVRNYDYSPHLFEGIIQKTAWNGRQVITTSDCLWGAVDGMNQDGLVVSLTFGGRRVVGDGFGIPLLLRYVLEFCTTAQEAVEVLKRVPTHMAYNVTVLDRHGRYFTVYIAPDRPAMIKNVPVTTNHQLQVEWYQHARATATVERERYLHFRLRESVDGPEKLLQAFLHSPVYSTAYDRGFGTLYTVIYWPLSGKVEYRWPNAVWRQSFETFNEGTCAVRFPKASDHMKLLH
jgi:predicted choloylglycine hydrolase